MVDTSAIHATQLATWTTILGHEHYTIYLDRYPITVGEPHHYRLCGVDESNVRRFDINLGPDDTLDQLDTWCAADRILPDAPANAKRILRRFQPGA